MCCTRARSNKNLLSPLNLIELAFINFQLNNGSFHLLKIQLYLSFWLVQTSQGNKRQKNELKFAELKTFFLENQRNTRGALYREKEISYGVD